MVKFEKTIKIQVFLIFLYLAFFPFGQLPGMALGSFVDSPFKVHVVDIIVLMSFCVALISKTKKQRWFGQLLSFCFVGAFSLWLSLSYLSFEEVFVGGMYFVRMVSYVYWMMTLTLLVGKVGKFRELMHGSLILVGGTILFIGFVQYLWLGDLRALKYLGWDDHLFRLVSSFLDPAFAGIILVLTALLAVLRVKRRKTKGWLVLLGLVLIGIGLTYSRASYLALLSGMGVLAWQGKGKRLFMGVMVIFLLMIPLLPRPGGEGVKLERTRSLALKVDNYRESLKMIEKYPVLGVGFNNVCVARKMFCEECEFGKNSCSGFDNSALFVLATTGVVGLMLFVEAGRGLIVSTSQNIYGKAFLGSAMAILVHSMFTNTLFYSWVVGWMAVLVALSRKSRD